MTTDICFFDTLAAGYFIMGVVTCIVFGMALYIFYLFDRKEKARHRNKIKRMYVEFNKQVVYDSIYRDKKIKNYKKTKRR